MLDNASRESLPQARSGDLAQFGGGAGALAFPGAAGDAGGGLGFSPAELLYAVLRHRKLIITFLLASLVAALIYTSLQPSVYQGLSRMEVLPETVKAVQDFQMVRDNNQDRAVMTAREWLVSGDVARRVGADLNLSQNDAFMGQIVGKPANGVFARFFRSDTAARIAKIPLAQRQEMVVARLRSMLTVRPIPGTNIVELQFRDETPALAASIADQYIKSYIAQRMDQTATASSGARDLIQETVAEVKTKLEKAEEKLINYARENNLRLDENNNSMLQGDINATSTALREVEKQRIEQQHHIVVINQGNAAALPQILENKGIQSLRDKMSELRAQWQSNLATMKPAMPEMRQLQARIQETQSELGKALQIAVDTVKLTFSETLAREKALRTRLDELENQRSNLMSNSITYTILKRDADSLRTQYQSLLAKLNDVGVTADMRMPVASVVERSLPPRSPVSPKLWINLAVAAVIALMLATATVYIIELLSNSFSQPDQVEATLQVPLLGVVPAIDPGQLREAAKDVKSSLSEAYRSLRTSIQFSGADGAPQVLSVTSTEPGEGKTTTSWRLAHEFAGLGLRVLVIDADMRKPSMHRYFGTGHTAGLSNLLTSQGLSEELGRVVHKTDEPNLFFISSGPMPPNPADLLTSARMSLIVASCRNAFDITIIDCPPVIGLADAPLIGRITDATLLVVSSRNVSRKAAANAAKRLRSTGAVLIGAVLNKFSVDRFDYNYEYRYVYYNSYYNYGDKQASLEEKPDALSDAKTNDSTMGRWTGRARGVLSDLVARYQQNSRNG